MREKSDSALYRYMARKRNCGKKLVKQGFYELYMPGNSLPRITAAEPTVAKLVYSHG